MNANLSSVAAIISKWAFKKNQLLMCCQDFLGENLVSISLTEVGKVLGLILEPNTPRSTRVEFQQLVFKNVVLKF